MGVIQQQMGGDAGNELEFCTNIHFVDVQANSLFNRLYCQTDILAFLCPLVVILIATNSNRVSEPSCFFFGLLWTLVTMVIRFPTVINQKACPPGRGRGEGSTEQCGVFKNQDDMPLWPECTNCAWLCSLVIYS